MPRTFSIRVRHRPDRGRADCRLRRPREAGCREPGGPHSRHLVDVEECNPLCSSVADAKAASRRPSLSIEASRWDFAYASRSSRDGRPPERFEDRAGYIVSVASTAVTASTHRAAEPYPQVPEFPPSTTKRPSEAVGGATNVRRSGARAPRETGCRAGQSFESLGRLSHHSLTQRSEASHHHPPDRSNLAYTCQ